MHGKDGGLAQKLNTITEDAHKKIEQLPFPQRYKTKDLTLVDHYLHLKEIYVIYNALYRVIDQQYTKEKDCATKQLYLLDFIATIFAINKDLEILKNIISCRVSSNLLSLKNCQETKEYEKRIASLKKPEEILAHCYVRWSRDSLRSEELKEKLLELYGPYKQNKPDDQDEPGPPVTFYTLTITAETLTKNLNALGPLGKEKEESILQEVMRVFPYYESMLEGLEERRQNYINPKKDYNCFNIISTITGVVVLGTAISYGYYKNFQPK